MLFDSVPQAFGPQFAPAMLQLTPLFCTSFWTVAVKFCIWPTLSACVCGEILTLIGADGAVMVIVAGADLAGFDTDVAIRIMVGDAGICGGAV